MELVLRRVILGWFVLPRVVVWVSMVGGKLLTD